MALFEGEVISKLLLLGATELKRPGLSNLMEGFDVGDGLEVNETVLMFIFHAIQRQLFITSLL